MTRARARRRIDACLPLATTRREFFGNDTELDRACVLATGIVDAVGRPRIGAWPSRSLQQVSLSSLPSSVNGSIAARATA